MDGMNTMGSVCLKWELEMKTGKRDVGALFQAEAEETLVLFASLI